MAARTPDGPPPPPTVQRVRVRYAKRGRLRFTSHRDFARAFERALRRADVPMAYSAGFTPHPKISYLGASPTGVASEAEYLEIGLAMRVDVDELRTRLDAALPDGLDVVQAVEAGPGAPSLADLMQASRWQIELPGVAVDDARRAVEALLEQSTLELERVTKTGRRAVDVRAPIVRAEVHAAPGAPPDRSAVAVVASARPGPSVASHAILDLVVRQVTPVVRPDDVVAALRVVAGLAPAAPPVAARLAQGPLGDDETVGDPLIADPRLATPSP